MGKTLTLKNLRVWPGNGHEFNYRDISIKNGIIVNTPVKHARIYNMEGYWAVPGFTDSHVHLVAYAISESRLRLDGMDLETIQNKVKIAVERFSDGSWIRGRGWEAAHRVQGGFPHRREIDHLTENHPLAISSKDGHSLWLNTCALSKLNIPADISDPPGGRYDRGPEGELTGVIREKAADAIISMLPSESDHEKRRLLKDAVMRLNRHGIVAVHSFEGLKEFNLLLEMAESGDLPLKVTCSFNLTDFDAVIREHLKAGAGKGWVRLSGVKLYADGALGSRSAAVTKAYTDEPDNYGIDVMTDIEMKREAIRAADHGLPTAIHAIGDRAVRNALIALVAARKRAPEIKGLRVEHAQLIQQSDLYTFASHDICASIQPCHMISDIEMAERFWANQTGMLYPYGSLFKTGAKIIFGSDAPIDDENPLKNIRGAITRRRIEGKWSDCSWHSNECMSVVEAFVACTSGPADIEIGPRRGRLEPGMPADLVIFGENPFEKFPDRLHEINIVTVFVDGQRVK